MKFTILTYNVKFLPKYILSLENNKRAKLIAEKIGKNKNIEIVTFNEAFDSTARGILINELKKYKFLYNSNVVNKNNIYHNGGIFIISKYPIELHDIYIFNNSSGSDSLANKGVSYAKIIIKNIHTVNVFTTHLQAWPEGSKIRKKQIQELLSFIESKKIPKKEIVIITGDFNQTFEEIEKDSNNTLIDVKKISKQVYTLDFKNNSLVDEESREILDYILLLKEFKKPVECYSKVLQFKTKYPYVIDVWKILFFSESISTKDLSDHYALIGSFEF